jgi:hypothetical protein
MTARQIAFNHIMSRARVEVEHSYAMIINNWRQNMRKRDSRIHNSNLSGRYKVSILLNNIMTYIRGGNQVADVFNCKPPTLEEYLHGL